MKRIFKAVTYGAYGAAGAVLTGGAFGWMGPADCAVVLIGLCSIVVICRGEEKAADCRERRAAAEAARRAAYKKAFFREMDRL